MIPIRYCQAASLLLFQLVMAPTVSGADVTFYLVAKGKEFNQNAPGLPVPKNSPARFTAQVGLSATNSVTNATVQALPAGAVNILTQQINGSGQPVDSFIYQPKFSNQTALDTAFPNGNYQLNIGAVHDGTKTLSLGLTGNAYPASAPFITSNFDTNFNVVIISNSADAFTLSWAPFTEGTTHDFILVMLGDILGNPVFQTPQPGQPGALNGAATSVMIPAKTLPSGAQIEGELIFAKIVQSNLTSYAGVPGYAAYYSGTSFGLVTLSHDVLFYNLSKHQVFNQSSSGAPALAGKPFRFVAQVVATLSNSVTSAFLQPPNVVTNETLTPDPTDTLLVFQQNFTTQSGMDSAFVAGQYALQINTVHDGSPLVHMTMPSDAFPNAPHISNWDAAQNLNPATDLKLTWDVFSSAARQDDIHIVVTDSIGNSVTDVLVPSNATSFDFPAGTFQSGQIYPGQVQFRHFASLDYATYPGATGSVRFISRTLFNITTLSGASQPVLTILTTNGLSPFQLLLSGQSGLLYAIDASTNLTSWLPLVTNAAVAGQFTFPDTQSSNFPNRFYRGRAAN